MLDPQRPGVQKDRFIPKALCTAPGVASRRQVHFFQRRPVFRNHDVLGSQAPSRQERAEMRCYHNYRVTTQHDSFLKLPKRECDHMRQRSELGTEKELQSSAIHVLYPMNEADVLPKTERQGLRLHVDRRVSRKYDIRFFVLNERTQVPRVGPLG